MRNFPGEWINNGSKMGVVDYVEDHVLPPYKGFTRLSPLKCDLYYGVLNMGQYEEQKAINGQ